MVKHWHLADRRRLNALVTRSYLYFITALAACLLGSAAAAQDWPSRTVRLVVPSPPGGGTDTYARLLAQGLGQSLKQQIIVDNRPGAGGNLGAEVAAKAA